MQLSFSLEDVLGTTPNKQCVLAIYLLMEVEAACLYILNICWQMVGGTDYDGQYTINYDQQRRISAILHQAGNTESYTYDSNNRQ
jgi:YD repeat-containing protein